MRLFYPAFFVAFCAFWSCISDPSTKKTEPSPSSDPTPEEIRKEISSLPFKYVVSQTRLPEHERITRITLATGTLLVETQSNTLYAVDRDDLTLLWQFQFGHPLDYPPVAVPGAAEEVAQLKKEEQELKVALDDEKEKRLPNMDKIRELEQNLSKAANDEERKKLEDELNAEKRRREPDYKKIEKWRNELQANRERQKISYSNDNVYLFAKGTLYCLDRRKGYLLWRKRDFTFTPSATPYAIRTHVFVPDSQYGRVYRLMVEKNGDEEQFYYATSETTENEVVNQPVYYEGVVYFVSHNGKIYAYKEKSDLPSWAYRTSGPVKADPLLYKYTYTWQRQVQGKDKTETSEITFLFVGSLDRAFYAMDAKSGEVLWHYETGGPIKTSAVASGATVYLRNEYNWFFALDVYPVLKDIQGAVVKGESERNVIKSRGELRWRKRDLERFLVKGKERSYFLDTHQEIWAIDEITGKPHGRYPLQHLKFLVTNTLDDVFYGATENGYLYALRESTTEY